MSNEQSIRDALAAVIHENFNACRGRNGVSPDALADAILASPVIRRIQAEALREAARFLRSPENPQRGSDFCRESYAMDDAGYQLFQYADRIERGETA